MSASTIASERNEAVVEYFPPIPRTVHDTGLDLNFLVTSMLKTVYVNGLETTAQIRDALGLSRAIVTTLLEDALDKALLEVLGRAGESALSDLRHALTIKGREWAVEALDQSKYVGPAPVTLTDYHGQVRRQYLTNDRVDHDSLSRCFSDLVLEDDFVARLGPAVNSGRSTLFYGPPGNGKTSVAQAIGGAFRQTVYVPHSLEVDGQIIKLYDPTIHVRVAAESEPADTAERVRGGRKEEIDRRWVRCRRPVVITGGELTLEMLDLSFNSTAKYYEAPLQLKATNGVFVIDDFGRQIVSPKEVLNRWIIPLERRMDYLTLATGKQFPVPFDELVIFSTNFQPKDFMDAGMMRRIPYKLEFDEPSEEDYREIFERVCREHTIGLPDDLVPFLLNEHYREKGIPRARFHPKWIVEQVVGKSDYHGIAPELDRELVAEALRNLDTAY